MLMTIYVFIFLFSSIELVWLVAVVFPGCLQVCEFIVVFSGLS